MALPARKISVEEYLAAEEAAEWPSEYYDGKVFPIEAASIHHQTISINLGTSLSNQLRGKDCRALPTPRVGPLEKGPFVLPDLAIICGAMETRALDRNTIVNPRVIIEIVSNSTERNDRGMKAWFYRALPSVLEYVIVSQTEPWIVHDVRGPAGKWSFEDINGLDAVLRLESVPVEIPLADIYRDVTFEA